MPKTRFYILPNFALRRRRAVPACRARPARPLPLQRRPVRQPHLDILSPKVGLLWDVDPAWQVFANISRSAEVPSFERTPSPRRRCPTSSPDRDDLRDRHARPQSRFHLGSLALPRQHQRRVAMPDQPVDARRLQRDQRRPHRAPGHRGRVRRGGPQVAVRPGRPPLGQPRLYATTTSASTAMRVTATTVLPGRTAALLRAEVLYKHPNGFYAGPNVEWVPQALLRRQRQQPDGRSLCAAELQGRLRPGQRAGPVTSRRAICSTPATSQARSLPRPRPPHRRCSIRDRPRDLCRLAIQDVRSGHDESCHCRCPGARARDTIHRAALKRV